MRDGRLAKRLRERHELQVSHLRRAEALVAVRERLGLAGPLVAPALVPGDQRLALLVTTIARAVAPASYSTLRYTGGLQALPATERHTAWVRGTQSATALVMTR